VSAIRDGWQACDEILFQVLWLTRLFKEAFMLLEDRCDIETLAWILFQACSHESMKFFGPIGALQLRRVLVQDVHDYFHRKKVAIWRVTMS